MNVSAQVFKQPQMKALLISQVKSSLRNVIQTNNVEVMSALGIVRLGI
jgi:hypothetical protein